MWHDWWVLSANNFTTSLFNAYKKNYDSQDLGEKDKKDFDPSKLNKVLVKLKTESLSDEDKSSIELPTKLKQLNLNETLKPLWINMSRKDFKLLIKDVADNLNNKVYQATVNGLKYDFQKANEFLLETGTKKISENKARELYNSLMKPDVDMLKNSLSRGKDKRNNILNLLNNIESSVFDGVYFHRKDVPKEIVFKRSTAEGSKLRKGKIAEIERAEKNIMNE